MCRTVIGRPWWCSMSSIPFGFSFRSILSIFVSTSCCCSFVCFLALCFFFVLHAGTLFPSSREHHRGKLTLSTSPSASYLPLFALLLPVFVSLRVLMAPHKCLHRLRATYRSCCAFLSAAELCLFLSSELPSFFFWEGGGLVCVLLSFLAPSRHGTPTPFL
jgi:hypothetical protein